jgi:deazaflavin-dependent oxidoreductase (nitroreductase family)
VRIRLNRKERDATARILEGEERARAWEVITRQAHTYLKYQAKTDRQIPLVVLE